MSEDMVQDQNPKFVNRENEFTVQCLGGCSLFYELPFLWGRYKHKSDLLRISVKVVEDRQCIGQFEA